VLNNQGVNRRFAPALAQNQYIISTFNLLPATFESVNGYEMS